uniref:Uncharacterized protein n=1 Tax=Romanomermis culicivorax TaxID=13658 RepID=A0A915KXA4_ROMCU
MFMLSVSPAAQSGSCSVKSSADSKQHPQNIQLNSASSDARVDGAGGGGMGKISPLFGLERAAESQRGFDKFTEIVNFFVDDAAHFSKVKNS